MFHIFSFKGIQLKNNYITMIVVSIVLLLHFEVAQNEQYGLFGKFRNTYWCRYVFVKYNYNEKIMLVFCWEKYEKG